nr:electron transport complex subunit RsxA [Oceanococcus sp. HetDA_MAG_MS8]
MTELWLLFMGTVLVNNFVLVQFLGLCPFMGVSNKRSSSLGMALATTFVLTLASASSWLIEHFMLAPLGLEYLRTLSFIVVIAASVQLTEMWVRKTSPLLYEVLGIYLPLITSNCAVLGVALLQARQELSFSEAVFYGFGAAVGFSLVLVVFSSLRERLAAANIPAPFQGAPIALITAGIMSLAFLGFAGLA